MEPMDHMEPMHTVITVVRVISVIRKVESEDDVVLVFVDPSSETRGPGKFHDPDISQLIMVNLCEFDIVCMPQ